MKVIICGVVKNAAKNLIKNIDIAMEIGKKCDDYKILIYENNSTDSTKELLGAYVKNSTFEIIMEDIPEDTIKRESKIWAYTAVTGSNHPCRMEQIANARNKLIETIKQPHYSEYDLVVMIDFDASFFLPKENRKRVIYANSLDYYDYYALRIPYSEFKLFGPEVIGEFFWQKMHSNRLTINPNSTELVPVYSAFNGIGVYDKTVFTSFRYDALITPDIKRQYKVIASRHPDIYDKIKPLIKEECTKFPGGESSPDFYWKNNSGYDKPVVCEHIAFNFALLNAGYELYINPSMLYWWSN